MEKISQFIILTLFVCLVSPLFAVIPPNLNAAPVSASTDTSEHVILLHGVLKSGFSMKRLQTALEQEGYHAFNWDYDARNFTVQENAAKLDSLIRAKDFVRRRIHFIAHSIGALVVRHYFEEYPQNNPGRIVMIAPPNQGSRLATELRDFPPFRWFYKKSIANLLTGADAFAPNAGIPDTEFGIIAGGTGGEHGFTWYLPGDDDSVLSVEQTRLRGAADFIVLPHVHGTIVIQDDTILQSLYFIEHGRFLHQEVNRADML